MSRRTRTRSSAAPAFGLLLALALGLLLDAPAAEAAPSCSGGGIALAGGVVTVRRAAEGLVWDARYILAVSAALDQGGSILLAAPLPPGSTLRPEPRVAAIEIGDRIAGICVAPEGLHDGVVTTSFAESHSGATLGAPVARGAVVQIVEAADRATAVELTTPGFVRHVGFVAPEAVGHVAREESRRVVQARGFVVESPIFLRGDDVSAAGSLAGRVVDPRARARGSAVGVAVVFAAFVAALVFAARRLAGRASVERADALLASEIDVAANATRSGRG